MTMLDTTTIASRSIKGILSLITRTLFIQIVNTVSFFILAAYLNESTFGVFYIVSAVLAFLVYFSDIGLAAALVQKREEVTDEDLKTTFTLQQILILTVVAIGLLSSGFVASFYDLDVPGIWLFQALLVSFFLSSLKTIPSVLLERKLDFQRFVIPQIIETIVYNVLVIILAIQGFGITSFTIAILARGFVGVVAMYLIAPWKPALGISKESAKRLLQFGFPFQSITFLALLKDDLLTIFLGKILTNAEVGYVGFSKRVANLPIRFAMDNVVRITFPVYSRLQGNERALRIGIEKSLFFILMLVAPTLVGLVILTPYLIHIIPKYSKWEPALVSMIFFSFEALLSSISTPLTNFFNAIGKVKISLQLMIFYIIATWIATLVLVNVYGFNGVSIAAFFVSLSVVAVIVIARRYVHFDVVKAVMPPLFASIVMGTVLYFVSQQAVRDILTTILVVFLCGLLYVGVLYAIAKKELQADILIVKKLLLEGAA